MFYKEIKLTQAITNKWVKNPFDIVLQGILEGIIIIDVKETSV